jgi:hypothetical protein
MDFFQFFEYDFKSVQKLFNSKEKFLKSSKNDPLVPRNN